MRPTKVCIFYELSETILLFGLRYLHLAFLKFLYVLGCLGLRRRLRYCANLKTIRHESMSLNRIVADKSHRVIVASSDRETTATKVPRTRN